MNVSFPSNRQELLDQQFQRLAELVGRLERNVFWQPRLKSAEWTSDNISSIPPTAENLRALLDRLPIVRKAQLVEDQLQNPPYGTNLSFPLSDYARLHQTSGTTTGKPLRWLDTPESWAWIMSCWKQIYALMGLRVTDRLMFPFSFGPFLGFWAGFEGAAQMGNLCLAAGGMSSEARLKLIDENQITILACTPTYALRLAEVARQQGIDLAKSSIRAILVAGEPGGNIPATRQLIESTWNARVFDHWGMTEVGPLAMETEHDPGSLSVLETECIVEILHPETRRAVVEGESGELVITNLGRVGSPLLRYATGDIVTPSWQRVEGDPPFVRLLGGIQGRTDDMWIIRGNNVFPSSLEEIIRSIPEVEEFQLRVHSHRQMQEVSIRIECRSGLSDAVCQNCAMRIRQRIKERHHFEATIELVEPGVLPRFEMKAKRIVAD